MSVIVTGMDMPSACCGKHKCIFSKNRCVLTGADIGGYHSERRSDCPLRSLEDIKAEIKKAQAFAFRTEEEYEGLRMALEVIEKGVTE